MADQSPPGKSPDDGNAPGPKPAPGGDDDDDGRTHPFGWPALVIIALLIVGGWFLITQLNDDTKMQDCVQSGRRNCAPIDDTRR